MRDSSVGWYDVKARGPFFAFQKHLVKSVSMCKHCVLTVLEKEKMFCVKWPWDWAKQLEMQGKIWSNHLMGSLCHSKSAFHSFLIDSFSLNEIDWITENPIQTGSRWLQKHNNAKIKTLHHFQTLQYCFSEADNDMMSDEKQLLSELQPAVILKSTTHIVRWNGGDCLLVGTWCYPMWQGDLL